jgi:hypothetical protein
MEAAMRTDNRKRNADQYPSPATLIDRDESQHGMSRRQFLVTAAAAGMAAFGAMDEVLGAPPVWREAALTQVGDKWVVSCVNKGKTCAVLRLVNAKRLSPIHDAAAARCTAGINAILDQMIARNSVASRHPSFIVTPYAPFLAWSQEAPDGGIQRVVTLADDPGTFYQVLGIALGSYRSKPPSRYWYSIGGGAVGCKKGGDTQIAARLFGAERLSSLHDAELGAFTKAINAVLDGCEKTNRNPKRHLCFLVTPKGLFLAWSEDDDRDGPAPRGAVTAADDEDKVFQALGI